MRNTKGQFVKGHEEGVRFGSGQSFGDKSKYIKIGLAQIGKKASLETRQKMSTSATGRVRILEWLRGRQYNFFYKIWL
jgi:hypothetical protein